MFCSECGATLTPDVQFCARCGTPVTVMDAPAGATEVTSLGTGATAATGIAPIPGADTAPTEITALPPLSGGSGPIHDMSRVTAATGSYQVPAPAAPVAGTPPRRRNPLMAPLLVTAAALLVTAAVVGSVLVNHEADPAAAPSSSSTTTSAIATPTAAAAAAPSSPATTSTTSTSTTAEITSDGQAADELNRIRSTDQGSTSLNGMWVAQIASQYVGVTDTSIQPGPMSTLDILRHHQSLRSDPRFNPESVVLLKQNDFGKTYENKPEIWVTLVLTDKSSSTAVRGWCAMAFSMTVDQAKNFCIPRQMVPPHS